MCLGCSGNKINNSSPAAPKNLSRPENFTPFRYEYSLDQLKKNFSEEIMKKAAIQFQNIAEVNKNGKWKPTAESIDSHQTPEWLLDAKFGMFIDWGPWSVAGYAPIKAGVAAYPDWYERFMYGETGFRTYHEKNWGKDFERDDFLPLFTAKDYNPEMLVKVAAEAGMKYIIPFSKHHGGFCLWPSAYTHRNALKMGPGKDLIKPLVDNCKEAGLKFGFYFSVEEYEYPIIGNDGKLEAKLWFSPWEHKTEITPDKMERIASGKIPVKNYYRDYSVPQATEFIDQYDPDILWYDGEWLTSVNDLLTYDIISYFYNKAEGRKEVAVNDRIGLENGESLRFRRGDIFTSEYHNNADKINEHPWEENRGISQSFGYNWQDTDSSVISTKDFINMFVDIVSKGGNLLLIVNLDGQGALPKTQENRLLEIGKWLKVNGEGIYGTRMNKVKSEGIVKYTRSKDNKKVFAIATEWPGKQLNLKSVTPRAGSSIHILGSKETIKWKYSKNEGLIIDIPESLQNEANRPCGIAYTFEIEI